MSKWQGSVPLLVLPVAVLLLAPPSWPRWALMWTLALAIYAGCKWLTWRRTPTPEAPWWLHAGYLLAWPGMDAQAFLTGAAPRQARVSEWLFAAAKLVTGLVMLYAVAPLVPASLPFLAGWVGMIGLIMVLHFGSFHLLSCLWRSAGVDAKPLMNWPFAAESLSDYWSRRWNIAFRDLTHRFLFRPVAARFGPRWALASVFLFSGLVHDLVISVPAGAGYGGPTFFFVVQAAGLFFERSALGRWVRLGHGGRGWLFTMLVLLLPAPALFHSPFVLGVIVPFLRTVGSLP